MLGGRPKEGDSEPMFVFDTVDTRCSSVAYRGVSSRGSNGSSNGSGQYLNIPSPKRGSNKKKDRPSSQTSTNSLSLRRGIILPAINIDQLSIPPSDATCSPGGRSIRSNWSELVRLASPATRPASGFHNDSNEKGERWSGLSSVVSERLHDLAHAFTSRTEKVREEIVQPPTPDRDDELKSVFSAYSDTEMAGEVVADDERRRLESILSGSRASLMGTTCDRCKFSFKSHVWSAIDPQSMLYLIWLFIVTLSYMYNAWGIFLRATFPYQTEDNLKYWWIGDYVSDAIYILDIVFVKVRIKFINHGMIEENIKETAKNYVQKSDFKLDLLSLIPLDLLYLHPAIKCNALVRCPRILKIKTFWEFYDRLDQAAKSGHTIRVMRTMTYMMYLIHLEACGYYAMSDYEGINSNTWVYNGEGNAYIRCFYLATKTATSIGKNPTPTNVPEYLFMTAYWLSGVFVFALLIGQIRDIFEAASQAKTNYRKTTDKCLLYLKSLNVPKTVRYKVRDWFNYNWQQAKTLDENSLIECLPSRLHTDMCISVHYGTLSKVSLFQDCDKNMLFGLVSKLKPVLFLPMDYICQKGEVGTEMYIVMEGEVEVIAPNPPHKVLVTLKKGSVFGEISLLALAGGNRRTATVRSKGYSNLFILSKEDFEAAMMDYPAAHASLKKKAKKILKMNAGKDTNKNDKTTDEVIPLTPPKSAKDPKLLKTLSKMVNSESNIAKILGKRYSKHDGKAKLSKPALLSAYEQNAPNDWHDSISKIPDIDILSLDEFESKGCPLLPIMVKEGTEQIPLKTVGTNSLYHVDKAHKTHNAHKRPVKPISPVILVNSH